MIFNASELMCDIVPGTQASSFYGKSSNPEKGSILQIDGILYKHKPGAIGGSKLMLGPAGASSSNGQSKASISDGSNDDGKATEDKWNVVRNDAIKIESNELEDNRKDAGKEGSSANLGFFSGKDISITIFRGYEADLKNGHDAYEIEMKVVEETCKVPRNYQDLENLEKILVSSGKLIVPRLPDKKQGFLKIDTINLETLKWLVFLKKCIQDPVLRENQDLYNFLTKDSKFSEESISSRLEPSGMLNLLINWVLESFKQPNSKDFPADLMDSEQKFQKLYLKIQRLYEGIIKLLALNEDPDAEKMQDLMKAIKNDWSAKEIEDFELSSIEEIIREARKNLSEGEDVPLLMRLESILSDAYAVCCSFALLKEKLSKLEKENGQKLIEEFKKEAGVYENRINQELVELF